MDTDPPSHDVVVVAGGASRRMRVAGPEQLDKLDLQEAPGGRSMLVASVEGALATEPRAVIVVGPERDLGVADGRIRWTREDPPGGGPLAALVAGLDVATGDVVAVAAGDAPAAGEAVPTLVRQAGPGVTAVLLDAGGRRTLCLAVARVDARRTLGTLGDPHGRSVGSFLAALEAAGVRIDEVPDQWGAAEDVDTPEDADRLGWGA